MDKKINNNYYNWTISKGDYKRDYECTSTYERRLKRQILLKKFLKITGIGGVVILIITIFAFIIS